MAVHIPAELEAHETIAEEPVAMVDGFDVEEGNPEGFPSKPKRLKPGKKEVEQGGKKQGVSRP